MNAKAEQCGVFEKWRHRVTKRYLRGLRDFRVERKMSWGGLVVAKDFDRRLVDFSDTDFSHCKI